MGIDFTNFKKDFLAQMRQAANMITKNGVIDAADEIAAAKNVQSTFKGMIASEEVGDTFKRTTDEKATGEATVADLLALIDDPDINIERVNQLIEEKPVATLGVVTKPEGFEMAGHAKGLNSDKLFASMVNGYNNQTDERADMFALSVDELGTAENVATAGMMHYVIQAEREMA